MLAGTAEENPEGLTNEQGPGSHVSTALAIYGKRTTRELQKELKTIEQKRKSISLLTFNPLTRDYYGNSPPETHFRNFEAVSCVL